MVNEDGGDASWISTHWVSVVFVVLVAVVSLFSIYLLKLVDKIHPSRFHDIHATLSDYVSSISFSHLTACDYIGLVLYLIFFLPGIIVVTTFSILLGALIPIGFLFGLIEHKILYLWFAIVLFIQTGGILDLFADMALIYQFCLQYFGEAEEPEQEDGAEGKLQIARPLITIISAFYMILCFGFIQGGFGNILYKITHEGKPKPKQNESRFIPPQAMAVAAFVFAGIWKIVLICSRGYLVFIIVRSIIQYRELKQIVQRKVQWLELMLYFDLMLSGIPLGIITFLELFVYNEGKFEFGKENALELTKVFALMIDLVGASFLMWFIMVGLIHKIPLLSHHHHEHHGEKESLISHSHPEAGNKAHIQKSPTVKK